ncbi:MAG: hypothetical protein MH825_16880 [Cyanobacteria bacterium]|nr:hypothetical protein [Cyanobacteriota bacterium]
MVPNPSRAIAPSQDNRDRTAAPWTRRPVALLPCGPASPSPHLRVAFVPR